MTDRRSFLKNAVLSSTGLLVLPLLSFDEKRFESKAINGNLEEGFLHPPASARPQAYWMWMNGHITKRGITLDLQTMKDMGLAGAFVYNTNEGVPQGPVVYGSEEWTDLLLHATSEAQRLGLKLFMHNSPGFSSTGGAKVYPEMSMQELTWSEKVVQSNGLIDLQLPQPFTKLNYYKDAFVIAYPSLAAEINAAQNKLVSASLNGKEIDKELLRSKEPSTFVELLPVAKEAALLQLEFAAPFEAKAITVKRLAAFSQAGFNAEYNHPLSLLLQCSNDGKNFETVCTINMPLLRYMNAPGAQSFPAVKAKYFRLLSKEAVRLIVVELHAAPRLQGWPGKINFTETNGREDEQMLAKEDIIDPASVINITDKLGADGRLLWNAPAGYWTILRIGHTCTGAQTVSSPDGAKGLEIDKFSKEAVDGYFGLYLDTLLQKLKPFIPQTFSGIFIDSWEVGKQNWSVNFPTEFIQRCGYDIVPWLPTLTGRIVQNTNDTEKFLWDLRRTQASLVADNYYGRFKERCAAYSLQLYAQPNGDGVFDSLEVGKNLEEPMAEFWVRNVPGTLNVCKQAVSIAHGYGRKIVAAEAYTGMPQTSHWTEYPYALKTQGDYIYSLGINCFVFHVFVHQPYTTGFPGMTMGPYGTHFDRNSTWAKQAKSWVAYLCRTQYLLQQGLPVADVCYFKGEDVSSGIPDVNYVNPPVPRTLAGDVIGPDVLLKQMRVEEGKIVFPDGMSYGVMILAPLKKISIKILQRLKELLEAGMTLVVSVKPEDTPGLKDGNAATIINELWNNLDGQSVKKRSVGKGEIYWNKPFEEILNELKIYPDFTFTSRNADAAIHYTHRKLSEGDLYFISNHLRRMESIVCSFRVSNKTTEIWNPQTGEIQKAALYSFDEERTNVPLELEPAGSLFVLFRKNDKGPLFDSVLQNGVEIISTKPFHATPQNLCEATFNNFTITLWIKPDVPSEHPKGILIFPPEGELVYGFNHAACGLAAGQDGVRVYERTKGPNRDAIPVIAHAQAIEGWTHLALLYAGGKPSLFINGKLAAEGKSSGKIVHPGLHTPPTDEAFSAYFEGAQTKAELISEALSADRIYGLYKRGLPPPEGPSAVTVFQTQKGEVKARIFANDSYQMKSNGQTKPFEVKHCKTFAVERPWRVKFLSAYPGPSSIVLEKLISLHKHSNFDVRHFSGTAVYQTSFSFFEKNLSAEQRILLHLGRVECMAEVKLNGKDLGIFWKEPFVVDITTAIRFGKNDLEVEVTNLWPNRMIGDEYLPAENEYDGNGFIKKFPRWYLQNNPKQGARKAFSAWKPFKKTDPLLEAGLLGPVMLIMGVELHLL
ncbi:glycosyl hydrolase [Flavisolibacter ginsenosidimutans]|uniref:Uncharacterized protein n=1 Tax=Flavisolibacter ginsenosidimutans TaxID=661481 RepID=A0A5B8UNW1_9BACT|nr:glycosyl hydrolase [Flavisolibacter ginsenosidimutans]QEC57909.1 hypothetical protein FSB75_19030 [Flavisolibacter ginsenosidimutans]